MSDPSVSLLIVDDSPEFRDRLRRHVEAHQGFHVVAEAADGAAAIDAIDRCRPAVVLLDLRMPGVDGYGVLRHLQERTDRPCVIVLTTDVSTATRDRCLALRADAVIDKLDTAGRLMPELARLSLRDESLSP